MRHDQVVDRFLELLGADPEIGGYVAMIQGYRALMGTGEDVVATLDRLSELWAAAKQEAAS